MKKILVSACLMGYNCRYKGDNCFSDKLQKLAKDNILIPVCPEQLGGLPTPRAPGERIGDKVMTNDGRDVTEQYQRGADIAVQVAKENNVDYCILKSLSPSCGKGLIYDGTFLGGKVEGVGVTVQKLQDAGFTVISSDEL